MIVDGHHRYKIVQKYPDIPYTTCDLDFRDEYEAIAWMCSTQLGRRNITDAHRQYLLGKRYDAERSMHGGDRRSEKQKSTGQIGPLKSDHATRAKIAQENIHRKGRISGLLRLSAICFPMKSMSVTFCIKRPSVPIVSAKRRR